MNTKKFVCAPLLSIVLMGMLSCSGSNKILLKNQPDCQSSVEGYYHCPDDWDGDAPVIIVKKRDVYEIIKGKIVSYDKNGVTFDPKKTSAFYDPKPKYYPFKDIETFIGENKEIIYGNIPKKYSDAYVLRLKLRSLEKMENDPILLELEPNRRFAFCLPVDIYLVTSINFIDKDGNIDGAKDYPEMVIQVDDQCSNYIGHLFLNPKSDQLKNPIILPYEAVHRPKASASASFLGGMVGAALYEMAKKINGIIGEHKLYIGMDSGFIPEGKMPIKTNLLQVQNYIEEEPAEEGI